MKGAVSKYYKKLVQECYSDELFIKKKKNVIVMN